MIHESDKKFVVPHKYIKLSTEERKKRINKALKKLASQPKKEKAEVRNPSVKLIF